MVFEMTATMLEGTTPRATPQMFSAMLQKEGIFQSLEIVSEESGLRLVADVRRGVSYTRWHEVVRFALERAGMGPDTGADVVFRLS